MLKLRSLYRPIQPSARYEDGVIYSEIFPGERLCDHIFCYWELQNLGSLAAPFKYTVVADGCIDIFWDRRNPDESFVMGVTDQYAQFNLGKEFRYSGIRFIPSAFPNLFRMNACALSDHTVELGLICRSLSDWIALHDTGQPFQNLKCGLDDFLIRLLSKVNAGGDERILKSLSQIMRLHGSCRLKTDLAPGVSHRQLRRIFEQHIGKSPKTFSRIVRFQSALRSSPTVKTLLSEKRYYDFGYYDQSHFIKEFKQFYGATPGNLF